VASGRNNGANQYQHEAMSDLEEDKFEVDEMEEDQVAVEISKRNLVHQGEKQSMGNSPARRAGTAIVKPDVQVKQHKFGLTAANHSKPERSPQQRIIQPKPAARNQTSFGSVPAKK